MQAIGEIISYFFSYYFNCHAKKCTKSNWGKIYDIFSPSVFIFSPLGHAIIVLLSQTVYWGENIARGKSNHIFPAEHNLFCDSIWAEYFNWGKIYDIFSPSVFIFAPVSLFFPLCLHFFSPRPCINCSTFAGGVLGENILCLCFSPWPCCMVFILPFFLDSFLEMRLRRNNIIFSPLVQFFS